MKRILVFLLTVLLLAGCQNDTPGTSPETAVSTEAAETTETTGPAPIPLTEQGIPWDDRGALLRLPLSVPDLWKYSGADAYGQDLLLWGVDSHLEDTSTLSLCLVDLTTGSALAQTEISCRGYAAPQVLGDAIYLCDTADGRILELDGSLALTRQWQTEPGSGMWYMGADETLYQYVDYEYLLALDLTTGHSERIPENASGVSISDSTGSGLSLQYTDSQTLRRCSAWLDLTDGTLSAPPYEDTFLTTIQADGTWLCNLQRDLSVYYLGADSQPLRVELADGDLALLEDGRLLLTPYDGLSLELYDRDGNFLSGCRLSDSGEYYLSGSMIKSEDGSGYYFLMEDYRSCKSLMYWDTGKGTQGDALELVPLPPESEQMSLLRQQARELEQEYSVEILLGDRCQTEFSDFTVDLTEDYEAILAELDELETALSAYPGGFFRQLRYYGIQGVQIQLVGELHPTEGSGREAGSYAAFTYPGTDRFVVVSDIYSTDVSSYYHEFSHNIDLYLEYCAETEGSTRFSEEEWQALNPEGFSYSNDYMSEFDDLSDAWADHFIDSYSTVSATEDRAQILECAMEEYNEWLYDSHSPIREKLRYYCGCIREAFDTTGWPEATLWEQYLTE